MISMTWHSCYGTYLCNYVLNIPYITTQCIQGNPTPIDKLYNNII